MMMNSGIKIEFYTNIFERRYSVKKNNLTIFLMLLMIAAILPSLGITDTYQGATSYTNAKEFYTSTALQGEPYHTELINGSIYYATSAKLAVSSTNLSYHTIGFDIELSGNDHSVLFTVQRTDGSMTEVNSYKDSTHEYILYVIDDETLYSLAHAVNSTEADYVLNASTIKVKLDAILTTKKDGELDGGIQEDGNGGFTYWGDIYRLKDSDDLDDLKDLFTGHKFNSYYNIKEKLPNHLLQIRYQLQGLDSTSSTTATVGKEFSVLNNFLAVNGTTYIQSQRVLQQMTLLNPTMIKLQKTGYHLDSNLEWITADRRVFHSSTSYMPKSIESLVGTQDKDITMYANWQPNTYTVNYDANGGIGSVLPTDFTYDEEKTLRENTFDRTGYKLKAGAEWNTKKDGSGVSYSSREAVSNLTSINEKAIILYANWEPDIYKITLDKQGGNGGTSVFYEKYGIGFFSNEECTNEISNISLPSLKGHTCHGYYANIAGMGKHLIQNNNGTFQTINTYYTSDTTIYAFFEANQYTITFQKEGGVYGTDTATATYGEYFPEADGPIRNGYTFKGYYTEKEGKGIQYYNEHMACDDKYYFDSNLTLYAHWVDETAPIVILSTDAVSWTNQAITLTANAYDTGVGLKSVVLYRVLADGTLAKVAANTACNGADTITLSYVNPTEGVIRYKAVATDRNNQTAESYQVVYYDITPPQGEIIDKQISSTTAFFKVNVTDVKVN